MAQTVVGLFENDSDAQRAAEQLASAGISRSNVDVTRGGGSSTQSMSGTQSMNSDRSNDNENGVTRFFKNLFGDDNDKADRYSRVGNSGYSIVTVHAQSSEEAERAADLLDDCGAVNVDEHSSQFSGIDARQNMSNDLGSDNLRSDNDQTISRVEEELQVGKREVETGGVRVRSRIVERPVEETLRLREEHVRVERQDVNRPLSESDRTAFQDRDIELTERAEVPVVNKEARVVEEIKISKDVDERNETIRDTVRNTEVDIDDLSNRTNVSNTDINLNSSNNLNNSNDLNNTTGTNLDMDSDLRNRNL